MAPARNGSWAALAVLALFATWVSARGLAHGHIAVALILSAALHAAWLLGAVEGRVWPATIAWPVAVYFCRQGFVAYEVGAPWAAALLVEILALMLACAARPSVPWNERLARWRRTRASIAAQLRLSQGILPWARESATQFLRGPAPEVAEVEARLVRMALPESLRQSVLTSSTALLAQREERAAQVGAELERQALAAAAACQDQCDALELPPAARRELAKECQAFLLDLIRSKGVCNERR